MKGVKIGLIVVCLSLAVVIAVFSWGGEKAEVDVSGFESTWKCEACDHQFVMTSGEYEAEFVKSNGQEPFHCKKCSELKAWMVIQCSECKAWFYGPLKPGSTGACPICHPEIRYEDEVVDPSYKDSGKRIIHGY